MRDEVTSMGEALRQRRRELSITQSLLARRADCNQSAISMYEAGKSTALSSKLVERIADILDMDVSRIARAGEEETTVRGLVLKYCPIDGCPSNIPYAVGNRLCLKPTMVRAPAEKKTRCALCSEVMESACPNADCGSSITEGSFCQECGSAYVPLTAEMRGWQVTKWADEQRGRIREIREMSQTVGGAGAS